MKHHVLEGTKGGHCLLLSEAAKVLFDYHLQCPDPSSENMKVCTGFNVVLLKLVQKVKKLNCNDEDHPWVRSFEACSESFTALLEQHGVKWVQQALETSGAKIAANIFQECPVALPPRLRQVSSAIVQASFLKSLEVCTDSNMQLPVLTQMVKDYVTLMTLDMETLNLLFPEHSQKVSDFIKNAAEIMKGRLVRMSKECSEASALLENFRTGLGLLFPCELTFAHSREVVWV